MSLSECKHRMKSFSCECYRLHCRRAMTTNDLRLYDMDNIDNDMNIIEAAVFSSRPILLRLVTNIEMRSILVALDALT